MVGMGREDVLAVTSAGGVDNAPMTLVSLIVVCVCRLLSPRQGPHIHGESKLLIWQP